SLGNPHLRNEVAKSWSVGVVYQPVELPRFHLAADWSNIHLLDGIENLGIANLIAACYDNPQYPNPACANFQRLTPAQTAGNDARVPGDIADGFVTPYVNTASLQFSGLITSTDYTFDVPAWTGGGSLRVGSKLFYREKYVLLAQPGDTVLNQVGNAGLPRFAGQFNFFYSRDAFDALLQALWTGPVKYDKNAGPEVIQSVYNDI